MIVIADVHLGKTSDSIIRHGMASQTWDVITRLSETLSLARKGNHSIVVAGDVFNRVNPTSEMIADWFGWLVTCRDHGVKVYQFAGNHDSGVDWMNLSMVAAADLPNVTVFTEDSTDPHVIDGIEVYVLPHLPARFQEGIVSAYGSLDKYFKEIYKKAKIVIGHGHMRGVDYSNDIFYEAGNALEIDVRSFPSLELMILGHIHNQMKFAGPPIVVYPGSLTVNNFGEVNDTKGYVVLNKTSAHDLFHLCQFESETTPWKDVTIDLTNKDETGIDEDIVKQVAEDAVVKITVLANDPLAVNESYIRTMFNRYGYVSRFETKATGELAVEENVIGMDKTHEELLAEYIKTGRAKPKALAMKLGREIIAEVLS